MYTSVCVILCVLLPISTFDCVSDVLLMNYCLDRLSRTSIWKVCMLTIQTMFMFCKVVIFSSLCLDCNIKHALKAKQLHMVGKLFY